MARTVPPPVEDPETGCLLWQGYIQPNGYPASAHRRVYEKAHGPIPDGFDIDHVWDKGCRYRHCIRLEHLEAVPHSENVRRGMAARGQAENCAKGHKYTDENTRWRTTRGRPTRVCLTCQREYQRQHYRRSK